MRSLADILAACASNESLSNSCLLQAQRENHRKQKSKSVHEDKNFNAANLYDRLMTTVDEKVNAEGSML